MEAPLPNPDEGVEFEYLQGGTPRVPVPKLWPLLGTLASAVALAMVAEALIQVVVARGAAREPAVSVASWVLFAGMIVATGGASMRVGSVGSAWLLRGVALGVAVLPLCSSGLFDGAAFGRMTVDGCIGSIAGVWLLLSFIGTQRENGPGSLATAS